MKPTRFIFTPQQVETAMAMRRRGVTWKVLAETFDCDPETIRRVIEPGYAEKRAQNIAEASRLRRRLRIPNNNHHRATVTLPPPAEVLFERDTALTACITLTAFLCGDPAPGRSALDNKRRKASA